MTSQPLPLPLEVVTRPSQLAAAVRAMAEEPVVAFDTESNSFHRYPEQLCLIQTATRHTVYVIDTIALKDVSPLGNLMAKSSVVKVAHGADYDVRSLDRHYGFRVLNLYDTNIAARFAGFTRVGLADLITEALQVSIAKDKRLQRADWGRRPLSDEALVYAADDVRHLIALRETLVQRLASLGRTQWVAEECARLEEVRYTPPDPETAFHGVKGSRDLDGRGLAILQKLFQFREEEARRQHRPPYFVLRDDVLVSLAMNPNVPLERVPGLGQSAIGRFGPELRRAVLEGQAGQPLLRIRTANGRPTREETERLRHVKAWRTALGQTLQLDPSLLWPAASLERLSRAPETLEAELVSPDVRRWQRENFADSLAVFLRSPP